MTTGNKNGYRLAWLNQPWNTFVSSISTISTPILISGHYGIGKEALVSDFSSVALCDKLKIGKACGKCQNCVLFKKGTHPDYHVLMPEVESNLNNEQYLRYASRYWSNKKSSTSVKSNKTIGIDAVRLLNQALSTTQSISNTKVVVINKVDMLNSNSANALLKSIEEPRGRTLYLLICDNLLNIIPTIRSRCLKLDCRGPSPEELYHWLKTTHRLKTKECQLFVESQLAPMLIQTIIESQSYSKIEFIVDCLKSESFSTSCRQQLVILCNEVGASIAFRLLQNIVLQKLKGYVLNISEKKSTHASHKDFYKKRQHLISTFVALGQARHDIIDQQDERLIIESICANIDI